MAVRRSADRRSPYEKGSAHGRAQRDRAASKQSGMSCRWAISAVAIMLAMETGCGVRGGNHTAKREQVRREGHGATPPKEKREITRKEVLECDLGNAAGGGPGRRQCCW